MSEENDIATRARADFRQPNISMPRVPVPRLSILARCPRGRGGSAAEWPKGYVKRRRRCIERTAQEARSSCDRSEARHFFVSVASNIRKIEATAPTIIITVASWCPFEQVQSSTHGVVDCRSISQGSCPEMNRVSKGSSVNILIHSCTVSSRFCPCNGQSGGGAFSTSSFVSA
jgi:hypothetical protein